ncbi:ABC transporter permease [Herbivorax sp. ANBcel31]|uniref:ABC transporter permease n=1 Tax=Herbivorax sp. ANBcel31 TaxID=3069754 RepID=UPI0027AEC31B|nr:ABC transporter permease [Herbivorax sp. ANBcel31]MDQ2085392.1 ABC transporter permease [Herbivorax sp. ANBcel31]
MKLIFFVIRRIVFCLLTIWLVITLTFILMHFLPGDPFTSDKMVHPQILDNLKERYGIEEPVHERYVTYLRGIAKGDLGISMVYRNRSVNSIIKRTFPVSLDLGLRAFITAVFVGLFFGIMSAVYKGKLIDYFTLTISMIGVAVPGFILATIFQYFFCYRFTELVRGFLGVNYRVFPVTGWEGFRYTIVPSMALAFGAFGIIARMMRESMINTYKKNYILAARAKGLKEKEIVLKHVLKNAALPVLSLLGPLFTSIILGSFVIESIFSIPGLGQHLVSSVKAGDYTMVLGLSMFTSFVVIIVNTLTDILYTFIDPRVRIEK